MIRQIRKLPAYQGGAIPAFSGKRNCEATALSASLLDAEHAIASGFQVFLPKPLDFDCLLVSVSNLTGWRSPGLAIA